MKLRILAAAKRDLVEGYRFYEAQDAGLGDYFITSVGADIDSLRLYAGIHPVAYKDFHRSLCRTFPFAIYYRIVNKIVRVHAVLDCRRNPAWIANRLK